MLTRINSSGVYPVTTERAKERLKFEDSDSDNDLTQLIKAATSAVEKATGLALITSTWEYRTDCWEIHIPLHPVRVVTEVRYLDSEHNEQVIDAANWYWERTSQGAKIHFITGYSVPSLSDRDGAIRVTFDAGYDIEGSSGTGDDPELTQPETVELCILFLVGHWSEFREAGSTDQNYDVPYAFNFLAKQLKVYS